MSGKNKGAWKAFLLLALLFTPILLIVCYSLGSTSGEEFSPNDFSSRRFSYNRVPGLNLTIHGKRYNAMTQSNLEQSLVASGLVPVEKGETKIWHLTSVTGESPFRSPSDCDAHFLIDYLRIQTADGEYFWLNWNDNFVQSSKYFWPVVADMARDEMYLSIPDVMRLAMQLESDDDPSGFSNKIDKLVIEQYDEMAEVATSKNDSEKAKRLSDKAKQYRDGDRPKVDEVLWEKYLSTLASEAETEKDENDEGEDADVD